MLARQTTALGKTRGFSPHLYCHERVLVRSTPMVTVWEGAKTVPFVRAGGAEDLGDVVIAASTGEERAWEDLTSRFSAMIVGIARGCRLNDADVGEVFQTTWLRLVENIQRIEQPERIGAWLATTARRESLRLLRRRSRVTFDPESLADLVDDRAPAPDAGPLAEERSSIVRDAYARLPQRCQRLLGVMSGADPPSYKEISEMLDMPIGSIGPTRGRCLERLGRIIEELGATL
jgi:RNA polymerase sigma factor (sigma-70 family)